MQLIILIVLWITFFYRVWPAWITYYIKHRFGNPEKQSDVFVGVILFMLLTIYVTLVFLGQADDRPWQQPGTAFNALLITAAIVFTAIRLFPPTFHAIFSKVIDYNTGECSSERIYKLTIPRGKDHPINLAIVNTGTFTWDNFRVGIDLPNSVKAMEASEEFPNWQKWPFSPKLGSLIIGRGYVQKKSTTVLTIGETLATRFFIRAEDAGDFEMKVTMTSAGRIGERRQSLWLHVEDELKHEHIAEQRILDYS
ncbi:hypothetical protein ACFLTR_02495 [Chloroflexota bacterium]